MTGLEVSGERMIEDAYVHTLDAYVIYLMHTASYTFVEDICAGKSVLDLGCGSGYGVARISRVAQRVDGVDVDSGAIDFARERYQAENAAFSVIRAGKRLPFPDGGFDVVLSFQVIEHVRDDRGYLREAERVLKPGGILVVVTPDRQHRLLPWQRPWNRWHVREYSLAQLVHRMRESFRIENALRMGAEWNVAGVEIRRYRRTKWLTLPFTLPFIPDTVRRKGLDLLHRLRSRRQRVQADSIESRPEYDFDETVMRIEANPPNALNLVVVGRKSGDT